MKKYKSLVILVLLFSLCFTSNPISSEIVKTLERATIYVDDDADPSWYNNTNFDNIQDAINAASNGDTIFVYSGTYYDSLEINKPIDLIGENNETTNIIGKNDYIMEISADGVDLRFFTIDSNWIDEEDNLGVIVLSDNNTFSNNIIVDYIGFYIDESSNNIIENNFFNSTSGFGIMIDDNSNNNIILNNKFCNIYEGIDIYYSNNNSIIGNYIHSNGGNGIYMDESNYNNISNNIILNNRIGLNIDRDCSNNIIYNNKFESNTKDGLNIGESNNNLIYHNSFINNTVDDDGINFWDNSYPCGGNYYEHYYSKYDKNHGPNQNISGSDGISDKPFNISGNNNQDKYPLMKPYGSSIELDLIILKINIGGLYVTVDNIGDFRLTNINWSISIKGGLFNRVNVTKTGDIEAMNYNSGSWITSWDVGSRVVRSFGQVNITIDFFIFGEKISTYYDGFVIGRIIVLY